MARSESTCATEMAEDGRRLGTVHEHRTAPRVIWPHSLHPGAASRVLEVDTELVLLSRHQEGTVDRRRREVERERTERTQTGTVQSRILLQGARKVKCEHQDREIGDGGCQWCEVAHRPSRVQGVANAAPSTRLGRLLWRGRRIRAKARVRLRSRRFELTHLLETSRACDVGGAA